MPQVTRFSIVTPSYNQAAFIGETIESVISQAGEFEIEYFVMDGGSTDGSIEIIKKYADLVAAGEWPLQCVGISMKWCSQKDNGQSDAINQGMLQATGNIVSYINSDDLYYPGAFARVAREFTTHPEVDFVYGDGDVIDEVGQVQWEWLSRPYNHSVMTSYHFLWNDFTNYIMQQATFWRRNVVDKIGYFDDDFHYAMDAEYWIRSGHASLQLYHVPDKLGKFRLIQGTKSLSSPTVFWEDYLEIYRRYKGSHKLSLFFTYYYYNLAKEFDFDLEKVVNNSQAIFDRWQSLPHTEQKTLTLKASKGFDIACLLLASELYHQEHDLATIAFKRGISRTPFLIFHPFCWWYVFKLIAGENISNKLSQLSQKLVDLYRLKRYHYRYQDKQLK